MGLPLPERPSPQQQEKERQENAGKRAPAHGSRKNPHRDIQEDGKSNRWDGRGLLVPSKRR